MPKKETAIEIVRACIHDEGILQVTVMPGWPEPSARRIAKDVAEAINRAMRTLPREAVDIVSCTLH
jgi:hypothetical protein